MRPSLLVPVPDVPAAVADAMALAASPELAAQLPATLRQMMWAVLSSHHGAKVTQRHRPANTSGGR